MRTNSYSRGLAIFRGIESDKYRKLCGVPGVRASRDEVDVPLEFANYNTDSNNDSPPLDSRYLDNANLRRWQKEGLSRVITEKRALLGWPLGAGKTAVGILLIDKILADTKRVNALIVSPRMVIRSGVWQNEYNRLCRIMGSDIASFPPFVEIKSSKDTLKVTSEDNKVFMCSWSLLYRINPAIHFDVIILDEMHHAMSSYGCQQSQAATTLCNNGANSGSYILGLTATLINSEPINIYGQINAIWRGRLGNWFKFVDRYFTRVSTQYTDWQITGVREETKKELAFRIKGIVCELLPEEVRELDKHMRFEVITHTLDSNDQGGQFNLKNLLAKIASGDADAITSGTLSKRKTVINCIKNSEASHHVVFTHFRSSAIALHEYLEKCLDQPCFVFSGDQTPLNRTKIITTWKGSETGVLICTMHSAREGINLAVAKHVIYAELTPIIGDFEQSRGRFIGLRTNEAVLCQIIALDHTEEEHTAYNLVRRFAGAGDIVATSALAQNHGRDLLPKEHTNVSGTTRTVTE